MNGSKTYDIKMLNGLVIRDISISQIKDGLKSGKYLPSDFVSSSGGDWVMLKESKLYKNNAKIFNGWMALFAVSFIFNIIMLLMLFWQNSRINQLLD
ncbi:MAG: hypothetical protein AB7E76_11980 [Deferribacterales bacterium]